jgi:UDP-N-acetylglucosamine acyltransferase
MSIDPSAIIHKSAKIHKSVIISAYAVIGANVEIGAGTVIDSHAVIDGPTKIGKNNHIYSFASIGGDPQDITYQEGQESNLVIGDDNLIREFCTINRGTEKENSLTRIGSNNMFMSYVHIAHDCQLGDHIIMSNNASLAGHVRISDWAILGGFVLVKQFCNVGRHTYTGMGSQVNKDIPDYMVATQLCAPLRLFIVTLKADF